MQKTSVLAVCFVISVNLTAIKQYQYYIFSWSIEILASIFKRPKAVTDLKKGLYSPPATLFEKKTNKSLEKLQFESY